MAILYFVEHTDPMLRNFYLFTDEKEPQMYNSHLCFLMDRKTFHLAEYKGESRVFVNKKYVKNLIPIDEFPTEEMFGDLDMYKKFEFTIKLMLKNI